MACPYYVLESDAAAAANSHVAADIEQHAWQRQSRLCKLDVGLAARSCRKEWWMRRLEGTEGQI